MDYENIATQCSGNAESERHLVVAILPRGYHVLLVLALASLTLHCKNDQTTGPSPRTEEPFRVSIAVKNGSGQGVSGLRISAWSKLPFSFPNGDQIPPRALSVTSVPFLVGSLSRVDLSLFEMSGSLYSPIWIDTLSMGSYLAHISIQEHIPTHVYKCRLVARALDSDSVMFRDSIYVVLHQPDASIGVLGWTDHNGMFQTSDTLLFPNVLTLPPIIQTGTGGPQPLGTFSIGDTVVITLTDTTTVQAQAFTRVIRKGANDVQLTWNSLGRDRPVWEERTMDGRTTSVVRLSGARAQWGLQQNYPNPFD